MILNCYTIIAQFQRELTEKELDDTIQDLFPFKTRTYLRDVWRNGYKNYAFHVMNATKFNRETNRFSGEIRVYYEIVDRGTTLMDDIIAILGLHEMTVTEVTRKWREE